MVLQLVLHPFGATSVFVSIAHLLGTYYRLNASLGDCGRGSLIINSRHVLVGRLVGTRDQLVLLRLLPLLPLVAALLLDVHLHRRVVVWVVGVVIVHETVVGRYVSP